MADEPKTDAPEATKEAPANQGEAKAEPKQQDTKTFTQDDVDRIVSERVGRERSKYADYNDLKTKASQLDELQDEKKSELEKLTGKVTSLSDSNKALTTENLRLRVALEKGLIGEKAELADRLRGADKEELEADADKLLALVSTPAPAMESEEGKEEKKDPPPSFDGGAREPSPEAKDPEQAHNELIVDLFGSRRAQTT